MAKISDRTISGNNTLSNTVERHSNVFYSLWSFACEVYSKPRVSEVCLSLQDGYAINVPLFLFCCWAGRDYGELSDDVLKQAASFSQAWSTHTTEPLRAVRREMKAVYGEQWPIPDNEWVSLREQVKHVELASERLMLEGLSHLVVQDQNMLVNTEGDHQIMAAAVVNIRRCCRLNEEPGAKAQLNEVLGAIFDLPVSDLFE